MPGPLDVCINNIYEDGNIPASAGTTPTRVLLRPPFEAEIAEAATADAVLDGFVGLFMVEAASAADVVDATAGTVTGRSAMLPDVFVNSGTSREANAGGVMVNL